MDIRTLDNDIAVASQVQPADLPAIARAGFRAIVCNRPDGESAGQPAFSAVERAARELGLPAHYLPAESGKVTDEQGRQFAALFDTLPKPVLAYCRSGMRSATLWSLSLSLSQRSPRGANGI
jgi:sulfide:quinone oxidoreductase